MELNKAIELVQSGEYVNLSGSDFVKVEKALQSANGWEAEAALKIVMDYQKIINPEAASMNAFRPEVSERYNFVSKLMEHKAPKKDELYSINSDLDDVVEMNVAMKLAISETEITEKAIQDARKTESQKIAIEYYMSLLGSVDVLKKHTPNEKTVEAFDKVASLVKSNKPAESIFKAFDIKPNQEQKDCASAAVVLQNTKGLKFWIEKAEALGVNMGKAGIKALDKCIELEQKNAILTMGVGMALTTVAPVFYGAYRVAAASRILAKADADFKANNPETKGLFGNLKNKAKNKQWKNAALGALASGLRAVPSVTMVYGVYSLYQNKDGIKNSAKATRDAFNKITKGDFSKETIATFVKEGSTIAATAAGVVFAAGMASSLTSCSLENNELIIGGGASDGLQEKQDTVTTDATKLSENTITKDADNFKTSGGQPTEVDNTVEKNTEVKAASENKNYVEISKADSTYVNTLEKFMMGVDFKPEDMQQGNAVENSVDNTVETAAKSAVVDNTVETAAKSTVVDNTVEAELISEKTPTEYNPEMGIKEHHFKELQSYFGEEKFSLYHSRLNAEFMSHFDGETRMQVLYDFMKLEQWTDAGQYQHKEAFADLKEYFDCGGSLSADEVKNIENSFDAIGDNGEYLPGGETINVRAVGRIGTDCGEITKVVTVPVEPAPVTPETPDVPETPVVTAPPAEEINVEPKGPKFYNNIKLDVKVPVADIPVKDETPVVIDGFHADGAGDAASKIMTQLEAQGVDVKPSASSNEALTGSDLNDLVTSMGGTLIDDTNASSTRVETRSYTSTVVIEGGHSDSVEASKDNVATQLEQQGVEVKADTSNAPLRGAALDAFLNAKGRNGGM